MGSDLSGVFITGLYGSGKSSVASEIAEILERAGIAYGAIDLDWLTWFEVPGLDQAALDRVYLENVATVVELTTNPGTSGDHSSVLRHVSPG